jgi:hypothetical protein
VIPVNYVVNKQTKDNNGPYTDPCQAGSSLLQSLDPIDNKNKLIAPQGLATTPSYCLMCVCVRIKHSQVIAILLGFAVS